MFLILTALAAVISTVVWYANAPEDKYRVGMLSLFFWGATLMWLIDHVMAYFMEGGEFFELNIDATMLGISVILLALIVWMLFLVISDPKGALKTVLKR
jgi:peptidoglycan biosynthesis protein MviN/MurJ (putative lipid II flippase)